MRCITPVFLFEKKKRQSVSALPFSFLLAGDTGTLDTLDDVSLHEGVENQQGEQDQDTAGIADSGNVHVFARILGVQGLGYLDHIRHQGRSADGVEHFGVEVIRPLPGEREHEYRDQHGNGQGQNDLEEGSEYAGTVQVRRLFELIRHTAEELAKHKDIQAVLERKSGSGHDDQRPHGVQQADGCIRQDVQPIKHTAAQQIEQTAHFADLEDVEVTELHKHGQTNGGMGNNHCEDNEHKQKTVTLELELREAISNYAADEGLQNRAGSGEEQGVEECLEIAVIQDNCLVGAQGGLLGNQANRYVYEVAGAHERGSDLRVEREEDYVGNAEQEQELEQVYEHFLEEEGVQKLCLQALHQRSTFKIHADLILGFLRDSGCFNIIHSKRSSFLNLFSGRIRMH